MSLQVQAELRKTYEILTSGRRAEAIERLRAILASSLPPANLADVGLLLFKAGDDDGSVEAARRLHAAQPDSVAAMSILATFLAGVGELDEAVALATTVCENLPENPDTHYNLGIYLSRVDRNEQAKERFSKAIEIDPGHALSLEYLAYLDPGDSAGSVLQQIEDCLSGGRDLDAARQAALHYAKATLLDQQQRFDEAFAAYGTGARAMQKVARADLETVERYTRSVLDSFTPEFFEANADHRFDNKRPVFIVGMPRSGTTLVESVFASHSKITAGGETKLLGLATMHYDPFGPTEQARITKKIEAGDNPWRRMGEELCRLQEHRYGTAGLVTEKNLGHHFVLGVIAMIASGARIIYCTRDPIATAWSCFRVRFSNGNGWSYDFDSIARYQRLYGEVMSYWQSVLPDTPILEVAYEDLVAQPAEMIPEMLRHARLDVEPACLTPHLGNMPVMTASVSQVREPIRTDANLAWRNYESDLAPYLETLAQSADD